MQRLLEQVEREFRIQRADSTSPISETERLEKLETIDTTITLINQLLEENVIPSLIQHSENVNVIKNNVTMWSKLGHSLEVAQLDHGLTLLDEIETGIQELTRTAAWPEVDSRDQIGTNKRR